MYARYPQHWGLWLWLPQMSRYLEGFLDPPGLLILLGLGLLPGLPPLSGLLAGHNAAANKVQLRCQSISDGPLPETFHTCHLRQLEEASGIGVSTEDSLQEHRKDT